MKLSLCSCVALVLRFTNLGPPGCHPQTQSKVTVNNKIEKKHFEISNSFQ